MCDVMFMIIDFYLSSGISHVPIDSNGFTLKKEEMLDLMH